MQPAIQPARVSRPVVGLWFIVAVLTILAACEVVILQLYVGAMTRMTTLSVELEYARGSALIASAQAQRCAPIAERK
jgi:hypothetical protein